MPDIVRSQCRAARALIEWSQLELADAAKITRQTVVDFERGTRRPHANNLAAIQAVFEKAGVEFIPKNGGGPGVRLAKRGRKQMIRVPKASNAAIFRFGFATAP